MEDLRIGSHEHELERRSRAIEEIYMYEAYKKSRKEHSRLPRMKPINLVSPSSSIVQRTDAATRGSPLPDVVTLVLHQQQKDTTCRGQKQVRQHCLKVHADRKTCVKCSQVPSPTFQVRSEACVPITTGLYMSLSFTTREVTRSLSCDGRRPAWRPQVAVIRGRRKRTLDLGRFVLVRSEIHGVWGTSRPWLLSGV